MKSIILIGDNELSLEKIEELKLDKCISRNKTETSLAIELESGRLYLDYNENIVEDYDEDELESFSIKNPRFVAIQFSSVEAVKALLKELKSWNSILVDDDKGSIVDINNYLMNI